MHPLSGLGAILQGGTRRSLERDWGWNRTAAGAMGSNRSTGLFEKLMARSKNRAMSITFADPNTLSHDQIEEGAAFAPRFDAHGLITAVAQDGNGRVLMVAHMNAEALRLTIETGDVHYYSRSRKALWKKGETSGEVQKLVRLAVDCDQDVILLTVEQTGRGAACHTGRKSCFYRVLENGTLANTGEPRLFDPKLVYPG